MPLEVKEQSNYYNLIKIFITVATYPRTQKESTAIAAELKGCMYQSPTKVKILGKFPMLLTVQTNKWAIIIQDRLIDLTPWIDGSEVGARQVEKIILAFSCARKHVKNLSHSGFRCRFPSTFSTSRHSRLFFPSVLFLWKNSFNFFRITFIVVHNTVRTSKVPNRALRGEEGTMDKLFHSIRDWKSNLHARNNHRFGVKVFTQRQRLAVEHLWHMWSKQISARKLCRIEHELQQTHSVITLAGRRQADSNVKGGL